MGAIVRGDRGRLIYEPGPPLSFRDAIAGKSFRILAERRHVGAFGSG